MRNSLVAVNVYQLESYNMYSKPCIILTCNLSNLINMYLIFYYVALTLRLVAFVLTYE